VSEDLILIVDDDPDIRTFLEVTLRIAGFSSATAENGAAAVDLARELNPSLILLDIMMPQMDGIEAIRQLRADPRTSQIPVIMVTAKAQGPEKVQGLAEGADDYVTKPFDPDELVARVHATLRRATVLRTTSPLTGLPGNARIEQELLRRVEGPDDFALLYVDLDNFKSYNDHYGFMAGDDVLRELGALLAEVAVDVGPPGTFVGHVGGDDFVVITDAAAFEDVAQAVCDRFDRMATSFYGEDARRLGYIEVSDRQGHVTRFPFVTVSIGIAHTRHRGFAHPSEAVAVATEMKSFAKKASQERSNWAADRRSHRGEITSDDLAGDH
jgi:diguanylate cyclase (GGDEF)-like protein